MTHDAPATAARARWRSVVRAALAPVLAFVAFGAWALASPVASGPDDDFHLVSVWCALDGSAYCAPGRSEATRVVPQSLIEMTCFVGVAERSAGCQEVVLDVWGEVDVETARGNFVREYPAVHYAFMRLFAGEDVEFSVVAMRLVNAALFVGLATALYALLPIHRRQTLLWGWLVTLVPLGMFIIPSNNPSAWAITGVGTAFLALLGWFETAGRRRWALGALYLLAVVIAAGARADAAVYVGGATIVVLILTFMRRRPWLLRAGLAGAGLALAVGLFATARQGAVGMDGFSGGESVSGADVIIQSPMALAAYNLLMLPFLWTGVWGTWALGWFDVQLPAIVPWSAASAFIVVAFAGLGRLDLRKAIAAVGVLLALVVIPVYVLTAGGDQVGTQLQPRYILPIIVLFALTLVYMPRGARGLRFTRLQTFAILGALALANLVSMQVNIRRYVTGVERQGPNLDAGAEWWWHGMPVGPTAVWAIGSLAFAALLATLWPELRREVKVPDQAETGAAVPMTR